MEKLERQCEICFVTALCAHLTVVVTHNSLLVISNIRADERLDDLQQVLDRLEPCKVHILSPSSIYTLVV